MNIQKVFFSYSRADAKIALKIAAELRNAGANIWIDQLDIRLGATWDIEIEKALESSDCLLVILSQTSVASNEVLNEINYALEENKLILPIKIDNCKTPFRIRRLQHIDLWHDYESGLKQVLIALNLDKKPFRELEESLWQQTKQHSVKSYKLPIKLFISYSYKDKELKKRFDEALEVLKNLGKIEVWENRQLHAGEEFEKSIVENLDKADVVCLLISPSFMDSKYCFGKEMQAALRKYDAGKGVVVPIIIKHTPLWHQFEIGKFSAVPKDGKPINTWRNKDAAWADVIKKINELVDHLQAKS